MRGFCACLLALSMTASACMAAESTLPPGMPAGVAQAQNRGHISSFYVIATGLLLLGGVAFLISTDHGNSAALVAGSNNNSLVQGINVPPTTTTTTT